MNLKLTILGGVNLGNELEVDRGLDLDDEENGISFLSIMAKLTKIVV